MLSPNVPDWHGAAAELVTCLAELDSLDERVRLLDKLCLGLGSRLYPAFLQLLLEIDRCGDASAKAIVADTVAHALASGRLPSGTVRAWGATGHSTMSGLGQTHHLGPIEFLCAWYLQPNGLPPLTQAAFSTGLSGLIRLFATSESGLQRYRAKLLDDAENPLNVSLSKQTRAGLQALAESLSVTVAPEHSVDVFLQGTRSVVTMSDLRHNPFT